MALTGSRYGLVIKSLLLFLPNMMRLFFTERYQDKYENDSSSVLF